VGGDVGETEAHHALAFWRLRLRFARLIWVPDNQKVWTADNAPPRELVASFLFLGQPDS
jgi:hypothetical protein